MLPDVDSKKPKKNGKMMKMLRINANLNSKLELKEESVTLDESKLSVHEAGKVALSIPVGDIENAFVEEGLGIGKLVIKTKKDGEKEVAYFTKKKVKMFRKFTDAINELVKNGKLVSASFDEKNEKSSSINTLRWLYGFASEHKAMLIVGVLLSLVVVGLNLIPPYLLKILIDNVILSSTHPESLFEELTIVLVISYAASTIVQALQNYALNIAGNRIVTRLKDLLFKRAVRLSASDIDNISTSRIQSRLTQDAGNTQWLMTYGISTIITNALTIIGIGVILFLLFPNLALYVLLPIPFIIVLIVFYNKRADRAYHKSWRKSSDLTTRINDVIPNYTVVKSAIREDYEGEQFSKGLNEYNDSQTEIIKMELKYWQPIGFLVALATVIIWWVGGNLVILGTLQLGVITAFLAYMGMFYGPIQQISTIMPYIQQSITSGERLREIFDTDDAKNEPKGKKITNLDVDVHFDNLWFGYDPLFPVIKGINATIKKGKVTSIVGKSGAGKSTIAKLLLGLYKIDDGDIRFGNVSINDIDINYLRSRVSYVPQDSTFFDNTVAYNISYYSKEPIKPIKMIATIKAVEMHHEIMKLPLCYDNRIRGRGMSLSGGQRQRLAIARAILGNPNIVLFDEITSSLDAINARKVNKAVLKLESDKTMIFVTHDMNEIMNSDFAIVMDEGIIAEQGKPANLLKKKGKLYKMFKYKPTGASIRTSKKASGSLESFVKDYVANEKNVKIMEGERKSFVNVKYRDKILKRLVPKKAFPVSNPDFIIFNDKKEADALALENYTKLDKQSKEVLEKALEVNNFNPEVTAIKDIKITGDGLEWILTTSKGEMNFTTKNRNDIVSRGSYIILIDEFNTPLMIDTSKLDETSMKLLESSI